MGEEAARLRLLHRAFRREARILTDEPDLLPSHLHNMLILDWGDEAPFLAAVRETADRRPWLRLKNNPSVNRRVLLDVLEHGGTVWDLAWSPGGERLASAGFDGVVSIWDVETANVIARLAPRAGSANALAWSPDGAELASGHDDGTVRFWDPRTQVMRATVEAAAGGVLRLAWSPVGDRLGVGGSEGTVALLEGKERRVRRIGKHNGEVYALAWSPDGMSLASGGADAAVRIWDSRDGFMLRSILTDRALLKNLQDMIPGGGNAAAALTFGAVVSLAWSRDGMTLAAGTRSGAVRLWDPARGTPGDLQFGSGLGVWALAWSTKGLLALGGGEGQITLADPRKRQVAKMPTGHAGAVRALGFAPDGTTLASCGDDGTIRLWQAWELWQRAPAMADPTAECHGAGIGQVAWLGDGRTLVAGDNACSACSWDAESGRRRGLIDKLGGPVLAMSQAGPRVLLAPLGTAESTPVLAWDGREQVAATRLTIHGGVSALSVSPDGRVLASGDLAGTLWLTSLDNGLMLRTFLVEQALGARPDGLIPVWGLAWSPDGGYIAASGRMGLIVWSVRGGTGAPSVLRRPGPGRGDRELPALRGFGDETLQLGMEDHPVAWSPDGTLLAASSAEPAIRLWKPLTGELVAVLEGHRWPVVALDWSRDGKLLASAGNDATVRVWNVRSRKRVALAHCLSPLLSVRFAEGPRIVRAADNGAATGLRPIPYAFELRGA